MKRLLLLLTCTGMIALLGISAGCRTPRLGQDIRGGRVPLPREGLAGPGGAGIDWPSESEWQELGSPLAGGAGAAGAAERRWEGVIVYFAYDRATIGASERGKIDAAATYLREHPSYYLVVEGHCDDRGSDEYNRALGERRALAVKDYLLAMGIAESRLRTISYGEERPAVPDATTEEQHAKNRRAEFLFGITP